MCSSDPPLICLFVTSIPHYLLVELLSRTPTSRQQQPPLMQQRHHGLQGPRPATLKVTNSKAADLQAKTRRRPPVQQQARQPVIIYVESPKVVHAHPGEFKSVVQRLTGAPPPPSASSAMPPPPLQFPFQLYGQLPLVASSLSATTAAPPASPLPADDAAGGVRSGLGFFISDDQLISPAAFLYDHQSMVANPLVVPPSLGACYRHGHVFVNQLQ